ncbi:hypothetical protein BCR37DRAFT_394034 [Protomyces lactucae-debilis]|uniref:Fungal lipase-type domain-containing protein n=1 Tax=Protomyces lactucae-debilis TaxID=2754530 RepID=A0A1Y2F7Z6_PROLT|nr:uncharacterized protein BCR37DRAFT_394034 [Protomyces lactucae-debilis]ORY79969.1 hypothetical protein BCR37DRAFT_394034 [Protomyces lactucae-debilis]
MNRAIDLVTSVINSAQSVFAAIQRIKNELHTEQLDFVHLFRVLTRSRPEPGSIGQQHECTAAESFEIAVAALAAFVSYSPIPLGRLWTDSVNEVLAAYVPAHQQAESEPWIMEADLLPRHINLLRGHHISTSKALAFVAIHKSTGQVVLSLPGTNSKQDWLSNLHSTPTELVLHIAKGKTCSLSVHAGFLTIAKTLYSHPQMREYLSKALLAGFDDLLLSGHSQAGAVMSLLGLLLAYPSLPSTDSGEVSGRSKRRMVFCNIKVITFGSGAWCAESSETDLRSFIQVSIQSFVRCKRELATWRIDPVPFVAESLLEPPRSGAAQEKPCASSMRPGGDLFLLLDSRSKHEEAQIRRMTATELQQLSGLVWLNLDASAHSMAGYVAFFLRQLSKVTGGRGGGEVMRAAVHRLGVMACAEENPKATIGLLLEDKSSPSQTSPSSDEGRIAPEINDKEDIEEDEDEDETAEHAMMTRSKKRRLR